ncbi:GNAT family N-acetyltransferase [Lysinibacillus odysseyi]|uniref:GCN5 family acetyltransferase n=1 Tax=Lysinibacillus odysseyi 34hs-1 = NBRC 100172 TaxID=1220589 RepID=A0A0A3ILQ0_9BACI|nr:GNAT family N-acetyltransferase [Lysinibacillus odysseyi]KGR84375.1 GCN5 family acetyltransferase [Lysinibacillus odysseyi 34hs-1 = NBRC 100172]
MITVKKEIKELHLQELREVYRSVGWMKHDEEVIRTVFEASTHKVFAVKEGVVIGFARALSDGIFNAAIYDVVVHKQHQGEGIARLLLERILDELKEVSCIHLISTTGNMSFYEKCGFKKLKTGMAIYQNQQLAAEYLE